MAKGEDAIVRKKNKSIRKKMNTSDSTKGMCFSFPKPEDPFNDKDMNLDSKMTKVWPPEGDNNQTENNNDASQNKRKDNADHKSNGKNQELKRARGEKESSLSDMKSAKMHNGNISMDEGCPSKFLISCLKTVQDLMHDSEAFHRGRPLFFDSWGFEFWRCYTSGKHVLETSGSATKEQIAWIGSSAVDTITKKEKEGESFSGPYLLFIVPSQEKATQVRAACKPLKVFGIHTVSLHPGASIDHQIHGLKTCEPEFIVCTPDRLLELVSMEAVDITGVCSLIIDGLEFSSGDAYIDSIKSIQQHISVDPHTVVFCDGLTGACLPAVSSLLPTPMCRLSRDEISVNKTERITGYVIDYIINSFEL